jgi:mRNA interferase YafQ
MFKSGAEHALRKALELLIAGKVLPPEYKDHQLQGEFKFYRECHIKGDVLLVYQKLNKDLMLVLVDIGSHASLFG